MIKVIQYFHFQKYFNDTQTSELKVKNQIIKTTHRHKQCRTSSADSLKHQYGSVFKWSFTIIKNKSESVLLASPPSGQGHGWWARGRHWQQSVDCSCPPADHTSWSGLPRWPSAIWCGPTSSGRSLQHWPQSQWVKLKVTFNYSYKWLSYDISIAFSNTLFTHKLCVCR